MSSNKLKHINQQKKGRWPKVRVNRIQAAVAYALWLIRIYKHTLQTAY